MLLSCIGTVPYTRSPPRVLRSMVNDSLLLWRAPCFVVAMPPLPCVPLFVMVTQPDALREWCMLQHDCVLQMLLHRATLFQSMPHCVCKSGCCTRPPECGVSRSTQRYDQTVVQFSAAASSMTAALLALMIFTTAKIYKTL